MSPPSGAERAMRPCRGARRDLSFIARHEKRGSVTAARMGHGRGPGAMRLRGGGGSGAPTVRGQPSSPEFAAAALSSPSRRTQLEKAKRQNAPPFTARPQVTVGFLPPMK